MEYMLIRTKMFGSDDQLQTYLNDMAERGWRILTADQGIIFLYK